MKQRDRTLDIAKGISMVLVVSCHIILCSQTTENWFECFCGVLGFCTFAAGTPTGQGAESSART